MLRQFTREIKYGTQGRGFYDITNDVRGFVSSQGIQTGSITLHLMHTSASLIIQENADPSVRRDFERFFSRLVIDGDRMFEHRAEGSDDMPAHLRTGLTNVNLTLPVLRGEPTLGVWQGIYLWEHRKAAQTRKLILYMIGE